MPITWAWIFGICILATFVASYSRAELKAWLSWGKHVVKSYLPLFGWYLLVANVFLIPLHIGKNYGPFTEGGGDVSVYADLSKYLTDHSLPRIRNK